MATHRVRKSTSSARANRRSGRVSAGLKTPAARAKKSSRPAASKEVGASPRSSRRSDGARDRATPMPSRPAREGPGPVASTSPVELAREEAAASATRLLLVTARDLMRENVVTVSRDATLSELVELLSDHRITGAPVTDRTGTIIGVVSMRDLIDAYSDEADSRSRAEPSWFERPFEFVLEQEESASCDMPMEVDKTVGDIMTYQVVSVPENAGVRDIARTMTERRVHRVLVERQGELGAYIGIIGTFEILDMLAE